MSIPIALRTDFDAAGLRRGSGRSWQGAMREVG